MRSEQRALPALTADFLGWSSPRKFPTSAGSDPKVIAATFEIAGLIPRRDERQLAILERFLGVASRDDLLALIADHPAGFWQLHDAVDQLHVFAVANTVERIGWGGGIGIEQQGAVTVLRVDPDIESKSRAIIDRCIDGLTIAGDDDVGARTVTKLMVKAKRRPALPSPDSDLTAAPTLPLIDADDAAVLTIIGRAP